MFKGLTQRAQRILTIFAQEEAKRFHADQLLPEHIILAMLKDGDGMGYKTLRKVGIDPIELQLESSAACPRSIRLHPGRRPSIKARQEDSGGFG
jgi:ATP-dependent Clp protease ATP-binding subunit ClpC